MQSIPFCGEPSKILIVILKLEYPYLPGGILLEILGLGVPPGSSNPDPISDQKMSFSVLASKIHTRFPTWRWSQNAT